MRKVFFLTILQVLGLLALAQPVISFRPLRYEEDYSSLVNDSIRKKYPAFKYITLSRRQPVYMSIGGELRAQYFYSKHENWGLESNHAYQYGLTRALLHADIHTGAWRTFIQLQSSVAIDRPDPSPVDQNPLDVHQIFAEYRWGDHKAWMIRAGRQELMLGSQRLVSVREGPNNRQAFDGMRLQWRDQRHRVDFLYTHWVASKKGWFDDAPGNNARLWGVYAVFNQFPLIANADFYYLGLWKKKAVFEDAAGEELRHSWGTRVWKKTGSWQYDFEAVYQLGSINGKQINAWTGSLHLLHQWLHWKGKPELALKTEWISGDRHNGDDRLQTFNPLFPRGAYFGLAALIGPANLVDLHPSISYHLHPHWELNADYDLFWRYSRRDGLYGPNGALFYEGKQYFNKFIGGQLAGSLVFTPYPAFSLQGEFTWFYAGSFLKESGADKNLIFTGLTTQFRF